MASCIYRCVYCKRREERPGDAPYKWLGYAYVCDRWWCQIRKWWDKL